MKNHMKTILFTAAFSLLLAGGISVQADAQVAINDDNFSWAVKEYAVEADDNGDGYLSEKEAAGVTTVRFDSRQNIDSFRGIEYFTDLKDFFYRANIASAGNDDEIWSYEDSTASELDLIGMKKLERVRIICHNSYLRSVDLGDCPKLEYVYIRGRECVDSLNLRGCTGLETLECSSLTVEKLNLSKLKKLETVTLYLHGGKLQKLNLKKCSGLKTLLVISDTVKEVKLKEAKGIETISFQGTNISRFGQGEDVTPDPMVDVEDDVICLTEIKRLRAALSQLDDSSRWLIQNLFLDRDCKSEREMAMILGISQGALHKRKMKILKKLKSLVIKDIKNVQ